MSDDYQGASGTDTSDSYATASDPAAAGVPAESEAAVAAEAFDDLAVSLPDGFEADAEALSSFKKLANDLGLNREQAQSLVDLQAQVNERSAQAFAEMKAAWACSAREDREYGGPAFERNLALARDAVQTFGSPELLEALENTGLSDHPEMVRVFYRIGKAMGEDGPGRFAGAAQPTDAPLRAMYPTMY